MRCRFQNTERLTEFKDNLNYVWTTNINRARKVGWKKLIKKLAKLPSIQDYELFVYFLAFAGMVAQTCIIIMAYSHKEPFASIFGETLSDLDVIFESYGLMCYIFLWIGSIVLHFGWVTFPLFLIPVHWIYLVWKLSTTSIGIMTMSKDASPWRLIDLLLRIIIYLYIYVVSIACSDALYCATYIRGLMETNNKTEAAFVVSRRVALRYSEQLRIKQILPWTQLRSEAGFHNWIIPNIVDTPPTTLARSGSPK